MPRSELLRARAARNPDFLEAVLADTRVALAYRAEGFRFETTREGLRHTVRLALVSDAFFALVMYRLKAHCRARGIPIIPDIAHRLAMISAQVCIGDPVVVEAGIYLAHGQVVIDGVTEVRSGAVFFPWVTIGLRAGDFNGPTIGKNVKVGTGAKVIGPVTVGDGTSIGANAVVTTDIPAGATAIGVPARVAGHAASIEG